MTAVAEQDSAVAGWNFQSAVPEAAVPTGLRPEVPHLARIYDYWLGGKNNYPADQAVAEAMIRTVPDP